MRLLSSSPESLKAEIAKFAWFHEIDFGDGVRSPGFCPLDTRLKPMADVFFSEPVKGKTMLDIGCWDGFFSIEAARRGARVLATDYYIWNKGGAPKGAFELARKHLAPQINVKEVDIYDISPETVGMHDVVLFSGVLYHARHPFLALEKATSVAKEMIIVETKLDAENEARPAMIMYPGAEYANDATNWWGPNKPCVEAMLRDRGFQWIRFTRNPDPLLSDRGIFHARRTAP